MTSKQDTAEKKAEAQVEEVKGVTTVEEETKNSPYTQATDFDEGSLKYMNGFGNHFQSECLEGALPTNQNNPQICNFGLYAEQLSGTPFTYGRHKNQYSWLYRILPSASQKSVFKASEQGAHQQDFISNFASDSDPRLHVDPSQFRWKPIRYPENADKVNFIEGIKTMCGAGDPSMKDGLGIHTYACNQNMGKTCFYSSDGDMLIVPQEGTLFVTTEFGRMIVKPLEICVIQRGIKFKVDLDAEHDQVKEDTPIKARGFICETYKSHFVLPDLGPIGANGLASARHFQTPHSWYEDVSGDYTVVNKFAGKFFEHELDHSPFDVVAWHGSYAPYKYDLTKFNTIGSISHDHPDPSIFTVLTCQSDDPGQAICDFVIFPPRWLVAEHTFRPPYYHRNTMSEFMGNIQGVYDAKENGFCPGASSLHSTMSGHGPEMAVFEKASQGANYQKPQFVGEGSMAFMFETCYLMKLTNHSKNPDFQDQTYVEHSWGQLKKHFDPTAKNHSFEVISE